MKRNKINGKGIAIVLIIALAVGIAIWAIAFSSVYENSSNTPTYGTNKQTSAEAPKTEVEKKFETYVGEDYDRYFMANMIAHHQGAIDMAKLAQSSAKHSELKSLANEIISAQDKEIRNMLEWQKKWGYPASSGEMMEDHSAMGMMGEMDAMTEELKKLSGDDFDKAFLRLMIEHHQSAIAMARPGAKNALHQEIKDLTKSIIDAQTSEIAQMKIWQKDWGY